MEEHLNNLSYGAQNQDQLSRNLLVISMNNASRFNEKEYPDLPLQLDQIQSSFDQQQLNIVNQGSQVGIHTQPNLSHNNLVRYNNPVQSQSLYTFDQGGNLHDAQFNSPIQPNPTLLYDWNLILQNQFINNHQQVQQSNYQFSTNLIKRQLIFNNHTPTPQREFVDDDEDGSFNIDDVLETIEYKKHVQESMEFTQQSPQAQLISLQRIKENKNVSKLLRYNSKQDLSHQYSDLIDNSQCPERQKSCQNLNNNLQMTSVTKQNNFSLKVEFSHSSLEKQLLLQHGINQLTRPDQEFLTDRRDQEGCCLISSVEYKPMQLKSFDDMQSSQIEFKEEDYAIVSVQSIISKSLPNEKASRTRRHGNTYFLGTDCELRTSQRTDIVLKSFLRQIKQYFQQLFNQTTRYLKKRKYTKDNIILAKCLSQFVEQYFPQWDLELGSNPQNRISLTLSQDYELQETHLMFGALFFKIELDQLLTEIGAKSSVRDYANLVHDTLYIYSKKKLQKLFYQSAAFRNLLQVSLNKRCDIFPQVFFKVQQEAIIQTISQSEHITYHQLEVQSEQSSNSKLEESKSSQKDHELMSSPASFSEQQQQLTQEQIDDYRACFVFLQRILNCFQTKNVVQLKPRSQ